VKRIWVPTQFWDLSYPDQAAFWEECESGRIGTIGNRVLGNQPWVQIPPPPRLFSAQHWWKLFSVPELILEFDLILDKCPFQFSILVELTYQPSGVFDT
jgi:hypothetical protein